NRIDVMFFWPFESRFLNGDPHDLLAEFVVTQDRIVEDFLDLRLAAGERHGNFGNLRSFFDLIFEQDVSLCAAKLQYSEKAAVRAGVSLDGVLATGAEHLYEVIARGPARRDIKPVGFSAELRIKGQCDLPLTNQEVERTIGIGFPLAVRANLYESLEP